MPGALSPVQGEARDPAPGVAGAHCSSRGPSETCECQQQDGAVHGVWLSTGGARDYRRSDADNITASMAVSGSRRAGCWEASSQHTGPAHGDGRRPIWEQESGSDKIYKKIRASTWKASYKRLAHRDLQGSGLKADQHIVSIDRSCECLLALLPGHTEQGLSPGGSIWDVCTCLFVYVCVGVCAGCDIRHEGWCENQKGAREEERTPTVGQSCSMSPWSVHV